MRRRFFINPASSFGGIRAHSAHSRAHSATIRRHSSSFGKDLSPFGKDSSVFGCDSSSFGGRAHSARKLTSSCGMGRAHSANTHFFPNIHAKPCQNIVFIGVLPMPHFWRFIFQLQTWIIHATLGRTPKSPKGKNRHAFSKSSKPNAIVRQR